MTALAALGAIILFIAACAFVVGLGWLIAKVHEMRSHRKAISHRLDQVAHGNVVNVPSFHSPLTNPERQG